MIVPTGADRTLSGDQGVEIAVWRGAGDAPSVGEPVQAWWVDARQATPDTPTRHDRRKGAVVTRSVRVDERLLDLRTDPKAVLADRVGIDVTDTDTVALDRLVRAEAFLLAANGIEWVALGGFAEGECLLRLESAVPWSDLRTPLFP